MDKIISLNPAPHDLVTVDNAHYFYVQAQKLQSAGQFAQAALLFEKLLTLPDAAQYPQIWDFYAYNLTYAGHYEQANLVINKLLAAGHNVSLTLQNRMSIYTAMGAYDLAIEDGYAVMAHPESTDAQKGDTALKISSNLLMIKKPTLALEWVERAQSYPHNHNDGIKRRTYAYFHLGDYETAFALYHYRYETFDQKQFRRLEHHQAQKIWRGQEIAQKTLLISMEQGMGDMIMMARFFAPMVLKLQKIGARLVIESYHELKRLIATIPELAEVPIVDFGTKIEFDYWIMAESMAEILKINQSSLSQYAIPYFTAIAQHPITNTAHKKIKNRAMLGFGFVICRCHK